jgi:hypothetical protein
MPQLVSIGDIADNLSKAGWSWGWVAAIDSEGRTIWIVDAYRDDGKRFVVRADEILTAFLGLESAISVANKQLFRRLRSISRIGASGNALHKN